MQAVSVAGNAFAPALSHMEPSLAEAMEEHSRASSFRDSAFALGAVGGGALALVYLLRPRR
jgi:hypothetical protein